MYLESEAKAVRSWSARCTFCMGALFYSSVKCSGAPKYLYKDILVHRCTSPMNKTTQGTCSRSPSSLIGVTACDSSVCLSVCLSSHFFCIVSRVCAGTFTWKHLFCETQKNLQ